MIDDDAKLPTANEVNEHANQELAQQVKITVAYALRQGMVETEIRRVFEQALNAARS